MSDALNRFLDDLDACGVPLEFQEFMSVGSWVGIPGWETRGDVLRLLSGAGAVRVPDTELDTRFRAEFTIDEVAVELRFQPLAADVAAAVAVAGRQVAVAGRWRKVRRVGLANWTTRHEVEAAAARLLTAAPFGEDLPAEFAREATLARLLQDARKPGPWWEFAATASVWAHVLAEDPSLFTTADLLDEVRPPLRVTQSPARRRAARRAGPAAAPTAPATPWG